MAKSNSVKPYSVGELISEELPFVHVLDWEQKSLKCDYCLKTNQSLKRCSKCLKMYYCDQNCQRSDWFTHKNECKIFSDNINQCLDDFLVRLLMRLWLLINNSKELLTKNYKLFNGLNRCLNEFESHESEIRADENRMKQFNTFSDIFSKCGINYETDKLYRLYGQLLINTFSIVIHDLTYDNVKSGYGLYICSSIFDHSCAPNASVVFDGIKLLVRTIKPIEADEEIFIQYIALDANKSERKLKLKNQYYFSCECVKCCKEDEQNVDYVKFKSLLNQLHRNISDENALKVSIPAIDELIILSEQIYGPIHPELAAILMIIMQYQLLSTEPNSSPEDISQFIERVGRVIQLSFGANHKFYRMYKMFVNIKNMTKD